MLTPELPYYDEPEGDALPTGINRAIDAHVHVFPDGIFSAIRDWFDTYAWQIRYRMKSRELIAFLLDRGISRVTALQYAHKPGMAGFLNDYMVDLVQTFPGRVYGMATVFPGEKDAVSLLNTAFDRGLTGVKLHAHVQCFDMNSPEMDPIYSVCRERGKPMVMHVGREPKSEHYRCDPYAICRADKLEKVLKAYPGLKICVPHLGFDEIDPYRRLIREYDTLWLDTAMVLTDYFPETARGDFSDYRLDRVMYGSDYPNIPYAWDRELIWLSRAGLSADDLDQVAYRSAEGFFGHPAER
ncbi:MAG: amidohydrolase [Desulfobacterales bacterium]|nr:amidohydrolase [Desulfobacterales bacterium]